MTDPIQIIDFDPLYQADAATLINTGLGEHFGSVDESMNPDLFDIEASYRAGDFLLALDGALLVGTGALLPISDEVGQISRMHTAISYRRQGVASRVLETLEKRAHTRGFRSVILETNLDWHDANAFYSRHGFMESARNEVGIRYRKAVSTNSRY